MTDDDDVLRELLRQAERVLDHQARRMEEQDDKTEQTLALGVATLGGGLALATWMNIAAGATLSAMLLVAGAAFLNLLALLAILRAYLALPLVLHVGPHPEWLRLRSKDSEATTADILIDLLEACPTHYQQNANVLIRATRERLRGLWLLIAALSCYAFSGALMLLRT